MTTRILLAGLVAMFAVGCATADHRSYTPQVQVVVKSSVKKVSAADYRVSPEDARLTGSGSK